MISMGPRTASPTPMAAMKCCTGSGSPVKAYLTGGPSYSHTKVSASSGSLSASVPDNNWGFNVGGGIDLPLGSLSSRIDVRYKRISSDDFFGTGESGTMTYIPITFGISF